MLGRLLLALAVHIVTYFAGIYGVLVGMVVFAGLLGLFGATPVGFVVATAGFFGCGLIGYAVQQNLPKLLDE